MTRKADRVPALTARDWDGRYQGAEPEWCLTPHSLVLEELQRLRPATGAEAIDLGAGTGRHALWLARRGWSVTAVDFSGAALAHLSAHAAREALPVRTVHTDLAAYRPAAGCQLALVAYVHPEPAALTTMLTAASRALDPGGVLVVVGHHPDNAGKGVGGPQDPALAFEPRRLTALLRGLRIERADRVPHLVEAPDGPRQAFATVVRARRADPGDPG
jgi:SAM-dependent methyltransferase